MVAWLAEHWEYVAAGAALLAAVLNVLTRHYSEATGVGKLVLIAIDLLSVLMSGGAKPWVKMPLTLSDPPEHDVFAERIKEIKALRKKRNGK